MQFINYFFRIAQTKTFSESALTTTATITSGLLGLSFFILAARILGPASFGILALTLAFITLISDIASLGTDTGLIRFIGKYTHDQSKQMRFLKLGLEVKFLVWIFILVLGWLCIPLVTKSILQKDELTIPLMFGLFGIGSALFYSYTTSSIQAFQKFKHWAILNIGSNALRLVACIALILISKVTLMNMILIYIFVPFLFFLIGLILLPNFLFVKKELSVASEFFSYNKWVAAIGLSGAVGARIDTFLAAKLLAITQLGIYSVAAQLTSFIPQISFALATVAAPKLAGFHTKEEAIIYLKKLQILVLGIFLIGLLGIPLFWVLIPILYGTEYIESVTPFIVLYMAQLIFLVALPTHQAIFYFFGKPKIMFYTSFLVTVTIAISGWFFIENFAILGAAFAVLLGNLIGLILPAIWVLTQFLKK